MTLRLVVDPIRCDAFGYCAELAPEFIHFDEWGYPVIERDLANRDLEHARAAIKACPRRALQLLETES